MQLICLVNSGSKENYVGPGHTRAFPEGQGREGAKLQLRSPGLGFPAFLRFLSSARHLVSPRNRLHV